ncbi:MAG: LCP family protein [Streptococcaceae bacterium]|jgi:anionic cell wall polymer biosynthesis LytR-Cps2A-Psr (LCP) family protein|nr:LCP family protein [Streptococcaceae bacterium]
MIIKQHRHHHRHHAAKRRKYIIFKIIAGVVVTLLVVLSVLGFVAYSTIKSSFASSYMQVDGTTAVNLSKSESFTTLVIETGMFKNRKTCLTAVLASTNPKTKQTTFLNLPVDATLPNHSKIETAYAVDGVSGVLMDTKKELQVPINKVIQIDSDKIGELIAATGGITIQNPKGFVLNGYQFNQGTIQLIDTDQVGAYLSLVDENDQAALTMRMQTVSMALYKNVQQLVHFKKIQSISFYRAVLFAAKDIVKTDISFEDFKAIALNYNKTFTNTNKLNLHTTGVFPNRVVSVQELVKTQELFKESLK